MSDKKERSKITRLVLIGDGIVYQYGDKYYVDGSAQTDIFDCFTGIEEIVIWSRIYTISSEQTDHLGLYDFESLGKKISVVGIYNSEKGMKGYFLSLRERVKKLNQIFTSPALVMCAPISLSQWVMWYLYRRRNLVFIGRTIGDPEGIADIGIRGANIASKIAVHVSKKYYKKCVLQTWVSKELERKYKADQIPSIVFHDCLISQKQINKEYSKRCDSELHLLFVGRLSPEKGIREILEAMKALKEYEIRLSFVGKGKMEREIREYIAKHHLCDKVELVGPKPWGEELFRYMEMAHCLLLPSYNEGLGMVNLEAMAKGTPVIASNVGGIPDVVHQDENGILIEPHRGDQLKEAILKIYYDEEYRQRLCQGALRTIQENTREKQLEKFKEAYMKYVYPKL